MYCCLPQGGTIVVKTVLDNPDICQGIVLIAPSLMVDHNVVGPVKASLHQPPFEAVPTQLMTPSLASQGW